MNTMKTMKSEQPAREVGRCQIIIERVNQFDPRSPRKQELRIDNHVVFSSHYLSGLTDKTTDEYRAFIVLACNNHDRLVAENAKLREALEACASALAGTVLTDGVEIYTTQRNRDWALNKARAALGGK
jgi:hypothetical protein